MHKFTFHVVSLPHTQTTKDYNACAYTEKVRKFCNMMKSLGHTVYLYAGEENEAECDELITIVTKDQQQEWFGNNDYKQKFFNLTWNPMDIHWQATNAKAVAEIENRIRPRDFICIIGGVCQKAIADGLPDYMSVEFGVGYYGVFAKYKVFESYSHMHHVYGKLNKDTGDFFDAVIPNYFDGKDFPFSSEKDDYFLFMGRMIRNKGVNIAVEVTEKIGAKLLIAGQGVEKSYIERLPDREINGVTVTEVQRVYEAPEITIKGKHIEHVGYADTKRRGELMSRAKAVFVPTTYIEPFGGVSIEAMMCGTPVITTDFGVFAENVIHGKTGFRFRNFAEAIWAAKHTHELDPHTIRQYAINNFELERVKYMYHAYFEQLYTLWGKGWYDTEFWEYNRYQKYI